MSLSPDDLDALADAATPGPWTYAVEVGDEWYFGTGNQARIYADVTVAVLGCDDEGEEADARLIALAPTLARDLAALQRWAEKAADHMRGVVLDPEAVEHPRAPSTVTRGQREGMAALLAEYAEMKETT